MCQNLKAKPQPEMLVPGSLWKIWFNANSLILEEARIQATKFAPHTSTFGHHFSTYAHPKARILTTSLRMHSTCLIFTWNHTQWRIKHLSVHKCFILQNDLKHPVGFLLCETVCLLLEGPGQLLLDVLYHYGTQSRHMHNAQKREKLA